MLFSSVFTTTIYGLSGKCVEQHFEQLVNLDGTISVEERENGVTYEEAIYVPHNVHDSCSQAALSMFLSFYDAYWNDNFVPDSLEWDSGEYNLSSDELSKTFNATTEYSAYINWLRNNILAPYSDFINNDDYTSLHKYLILEGASENYYGLGEDNYAMSNEELVEMLEDYLKERNFTEDDVEVKYLSASDEELFQIMETQIDNGYPVIYIGKKIDGDSQNSESYNDSPKISGHVMIAYSVLGSGDDKDIKLHTGWNHSTRSHTVNTTEYNLNNAIIWLEIKNLPHIHSDNYTDKYTGLNACACEIYSTHIEHENNHIYISHSNEKRAYKICHCGDEIELCKHDIQYNIVNDTQHKAMCSLCFEIMYIDHMYDVPVYVSDTEHRLDCACGHEGTETEVHCAYSYTSKNNMRHSIYCECGHFMGTGTHSMVSQGRYASCTLCGVRVDMFTDITIKGIGDDENVGQKE